MACSEVIDLLAHKCTKENEFLRRKFGVVTFKYNKKRRERYLRKISAQIVLLYSC
jgi:hypothetical protein